MGYIASKHFKTPDGVDVSPGDKLGTAVWPSLPSYTSLRRVLACPDELEDEICQMLKSGVHMAHILKRLPRTHAPTAAARFATKQVLASRSTDDTFKEEFEQKTKEYFGGEDKPDVKEPDAETAVPLTLSDEFTESFVAAMSDEMEAATKKATKKKTKKKRATKKRSTKKKTPTSAKE